MMKIFKLNKKMLTAAVICILLVSCNGGPQTPPEPEVDVTEMTAVQIPDWTMESVRDIVKDWKETPKGVADKMLEKYGVPNGVTENMLVWHNSGDFATTILTNEEIPHYFPMPHKDCLLQVVNYDIPLDKYTPMARYDGSIILERTKGTMAARCDKEAANYLALNLAYDIAEGNKTPEEARTFYTEAIKSMMKGETVEYMQKLIFTPKEESGDPDESAIPEEMLREMKSE